MVFRLERAKFTRLCPLFFCLACLGTACSLMYTRPVQEMSDTSAAIRAAKDVQADVLAPELYREAKEWFFKARSAYQMKDFELALDYARRSRRLAEQAEFEVLRNGGKQVDSSSDTGPASAPPDNPPPKDPNSAGWATPTGTPIENYPPPGASVGGGSAGGGGGTTPTAPNPAPGP